MDPAVVREAYIAVKRHLLRLLRSPEAEAYGRRPMHCFDGGKDAYGRNYQPVWPKLAAFLSENGIDDARLFFQGQVVGVELSIPTTLCNAQAIDKYEEYKISFRRLLRGSLSSQIDSFKTRVAIERLSDSTLSMEMYWRGALTWPGIVSPLFAVCVATFDRTLYDLIPLFLDEAIAQFSEYPAAFRDVWRPILPRVFLVDSGDPRSLLSISQFPQNEAQTYDGRPIPVRVPISANRTRSPGTSAAAATNPSGEQVAADPVADSGGERSRQS